MGEKQADFSAKKVIANLIKSEMEKQNKSVNDFAKEAGVTRDAFYRILNEKNYTRENLFRVLYFFEMEIDIKDKKKMSNS